MKVFVLLCVAGMAMAGPLNLKPYHPMHRLNLNLAKDTDGFIVGGTVVPSGGAAYQVSLQRSSHFCGGTIIDQNWILTAAHCVSGLSAGSLSIRYNTLKHNSGGAIVKAAAIYAHEKYSSYTLDNDIALIKTATPLALGSANAQKVALASKTDDPAAGSTVKVTGWGHLKESGGSLPTNLMQVDVTVVGRSQCNSLYGSNEITKNMFCAGDVRNGGKDSCQGDSGGPVVQNNKVVGAVSWGYGCARPGKPGVYTVVANYRDWINSKSGL